MPKLSIIVPVYNMVDSIGKCLSSIVEQDFNDFELIVIDGASNDGSLEIIENFRGSIKHFHSKKDSGPYDAMNKGIALAQGEWFYFLGADDYLADGSVLKEVFSKEISADIIYSWVENIERTSTKIPRLQKGCFSKKLYWKNCLHHQGALYRKDLFKERNFNLEYRILADYAMNLDFLKEKRRAEAVDIILCKSKASGLSKNFKLGLYLEELNLKKKHIPLLPFLLNIPWVFMKMVYKNLPDLSRFLVPAKRT